MPIDCGSRSEVGCLMGFDSRKDRIVGLDRTSGNGGTNKGLRRLPCSQLISC
jgi:hypothetical protein